jgi:hypothetical protein
VSKSQAAFFRAAAHSPEIAAKNGLTAEQAREWMREDQKEGEMNLPPDQRSGRHAMARKLRGK